MPIYLPENIMQMAPDGSLLQVDYTDWVPTLNLRYKIDSEPVDERTSRAVQILQQAWYDRRTGKVEWRNIPLAEPKISVDLSEDEIQRRAESDPDNPPLTDEELAQMRPRRHRLKR